MREDDDLHLCVFTSGYYKRKHSLTLLAKVEDKSIETIETSAEWRLQMIKKLLII